MKKIINIAFLGIVPCILLLSSCTYLKHASIQADYARLQETSPSLRNLKHMIERPNYSLISKAEDRAKLYTLNTHTKAVVAFSSRYRKHELVDVMHDITIDTHFGLDLPEGDYQLVIFSDQNDNGRYERDEVIGSSQLSINVERYPSRVVANHSADLQPLTVLGWDVSIEVKEKGLNQNSLYFPAGTLRSLDDPIFSSKMSILGLYDPAAFFAQAPTLFYALEEESAYKTPVIFVHGIGGSAREFEVMLQQLDRTRFTPWFFHYPSGGDLNQLAQLFYEIFLSGDNMPHNVFKPLVIVAHSMGGLVVRESLNRLDKQSALKITFISLASPLNGHPSAKHVDDVSGLILPSWRDLNPDGEFVQQLYRKPLPKNTQHLLFYAYNNDSRVKFGDNSDGVVPLASQLRASAQQQASRQQGINVSHSGILIDSDAVDMIITAVSQVQSGYPEDHLTLYLLGGFETETAINYTDKERHLLKQYGCILQALAAGSVDPINGPQAELVAMLQGKIVASNDAASAWLKYSAGQTSNSVCH